MLSEIKPHHHHHHWGPTIIKDTAGAQRTLLFATVDFLNLLCHQSRTYTNLTHWPLWSKSDYSQPKSQGPLKDNFSSLLKDFFHSWNYSLKRSFHLDTSSEGFAKDLPGWCQVIRREIILFQHLSFSLKHVCHNSQGREHQTFFTNCELFQTIYGMKML